MACFLGFLASLFCILVTTFYARLLVAIADFPGGPLSGDAKWHERVRFILMVLCVFILAGISVVVCSQVGGSCS